MEKIFAVVVNFHRLEETTDCLKSIYKSKTGGRKLKVVLVENESREADVKKLKKEFPKLKIIENKNNCGFAEGNNIGIRYSLANGADDIVLINNDAIIDINALSKLIDALQKNPDTGIAGPKIYFAKGCEYHGARYSKNDLGKVIWYAGGDIDWGNVMGKHRGLDEADKGQYDNGEFTQFVTGCCMAVKREVFEKIGLLSPKFFLYLEDLDFNHRTSLSGFKIYYEPKAVVWHKNLGTNKSSINTYQQYYYTRNRMLFGFKWAPFITKLHLIKEGFRFILSGTNYQRRGIIDFYLNKFGKSDLR